MPEVDRSEWLGRRPDHRLGAVESWLRLPDARHPFHAMEIRGGVPSRRLWPLAGGTSSSAMRTGWGGARRSLRGAPFSVSVFGLRRRLKRSDM